MMCDSTEDRLGQLSIATLAMHHLVIITRTYSRDDVDHAVNALPRSGIAIPSDDIDDESPTTDDESDEYDREKSGVKVPGVKGGLIM